MSGGSGDNGSQSDDVIEEALHFTRVIKAFRKYKSDASIQIAKSEKNFKELPLDHQRLLPDHLIILEKIKVCIEHNGAICDLIVKDCENAFQNKTFEEINKEGKLTDPGRMDLDKVRTTLKQIVRDWSAEGQHERDMCYKPIIHEITSRISPSVEGGLKASVLVPGCGLGRLAWELARLGYCSEGNEFSFFMLFTSDFILNRISHSSQDDCQYTVHPWITQKSNLPSWECTMTPVKFPDVNPASLPPNSEFSMAAGEFLECYQAPNSWNCVATSYFIDTAHNIIAYIERIFHILTPGGLWVNMGPLLYHFSDMPSESSVEFSYDQIIEVVRKVGFNIVKDERGISSTYIDNPDSMLQYKYKCGFLVAVKPDI